MKADGGRLQEITRGDLVDAAAQCLHKLEDLKMKMEKAPRQLAEQRGEYRDTIRIEFVDMHRMHSVY